MPLSILDKGIYCVIQLMFFHRIRPRSLYKKRGRLSLLFILFNQQGQAGKLISPPVFRLPHVEQAAAAHPKKDLHWQT